MLMTRSEFDIGQDPFSAPGMGPATRIGQHLLTDEVIIEQIAGTVPANSLCVEIGPGFGALTQKLLQRGDQVVAYEVDERAKPHLDQLDGSDKLTVHWKSFLDANVTEINGQGDFHIVGNIPFHISEPLIVKLSKINFETAVLLVGDKLARAITQTDPGHEDWSRVSLITQAYFETNRLMDVDRTAFFPPPRVDGAVITLTPLERSETNWQSNPILMCYRAIAEANADNSTLASALKNIMIDSKGKIEAGDSDHVLGNRRQRRAGRAALKEYATQYNLGGDFEAQDRQPVSIPESIFSILSKSIDPGILSKPLSGVNNQELKKVCAVINAAVNKRTKTKSL